MAGKITSNELNSTLNTQINKVNTLATIATSGSANDLSFSSSNFTSTNVGAALNELFTYVSNGKTVIAAAITDKGVTASNDDTFGMLGSKISQIQTGIEIVDTLPETGIEGQMVLKYNDTSQLLSYIYGNGNWLV